ncbi:MAG: preprotein translocase subunit SecE [Pseudomonadota bacterium]
MAKSKSAGASKAKSKAASKSAGPKPAGEGQKTLDAKAEEQGRKKKSASPLEFLQQVRNETAKVTWTTRNETLISTVMVLIMVAVMAIFFFFVDWGLRTAVCTVLPIDCVSRDI